MWAQAITPFSNPATFKKPRQKSRLFFITMIKPIIHLIWAQSRRGVIGQQGALPWHLPEDLAFFKRMTAQDAVVMGRRTWESLPDAVRPLPRRMNLVLTRQLEFEALGAHVVQSMEEAIRLVGQEKTLWLIGGSSLFKDFLPIAERVCLTEIDANFDGDTFAPPLDSPAFEALHELTSQDDQAWKTSKHGLLFRHRFFSRKMP
jgi:dihydrofolate reductase